MEKYLISLLDLNCRVIVPDLGAFIIRQNDSKELVFNDLLSFDDGMLTDIIMQKEKVSKSEAQNRIRKFTEKVKNSLKTGKSYKIEKLGTLTMDESSRIAFLPVDSRRTEVIPLAETVNEEMPESKEDHVEDVNTSKEDDSGNKEAGTEQLLKSTTKIDLNKSVTDNQPETKDSETGKDEIEEVSEKEEIAAEETEEGMIEPVNDETVAEEADEEETQGNEEGFVLADIDTHVEVDATREDKPLKPDKEEPPFQIEEEEEPEDEIVTEEKHGKITPSGISLESAIADLPEEKKDHSHLTSMHDSIPEPEPGHFKSNTLPPKSPVRNESYPMPRKRTWPWIVSGVAIIVILLTISWFVFPEEINSILSRNAVEGITTYPEETGEDGVGSEASKVQVEESGQTSEQDPGEEPDVAETARVIPKVELPEKSGKKYYVVAGCFAEMNNAENYSQKLRDKGYDASIFGTHKELHAVCFNSHASKQEAVNELNRIKDNFDPHAWILYY